MKIHRSKKDEENKTNKVTIRLTDTELKEVEKLAEFCELNKAQMIRNLTMAGLEQSKILKNLGFMHIAKGLIKTSDFTKEFKKELERAIKEKGNIEAIN